MSAPILVSSVVALNAILGNAESVYVGFKEQVDWYTAKSRCQAFGGQLATFSSDEEYQRMVDVRIAFGGGSKYGWIGLHDTNTEGHFQFVDGDTSYCHPDIANPGTDCDDIEQWYPGEPNNEDGNQHCAIIWHWQQMRDIECSSEEYYICEFDDEVVVVDFDAADTTYIGVKEKVDWFTAETRCETFGGQLATFSSDEEYKRMVNIRIAFGGGSKYGWIGMHDMNTEGHFQFVDGDTSYCSPDTANPAIDCDDIDQWYPGEPNNADGNQHCAIIWHWQQMKDIECSSDEYYICEFDSTEVVTEGDLFGPGLPAPVEPNYFTMFAYSAKDGVVMLLAALCLVNWVALCVCYLRRTSGKTVRYAKVVADTDEDSALSV